LRNETSLIGGNIKKLCFKRKWAESFSASKSH